MTSPSVAELLQHQLRFGWVNARRTLDGLTEDEYFWEPVTPCWSIRRRSEAERGWGAGEFVCEDAWPPPDPLSTTTIGWRVIHLAAWTDIYRGFAFENAQPDLNDADVPGTAAEGLAWLIQAQDRFLDAVDALTDAGFEESRPVHWGESIPTVQIVSLQLTEHVHHLAEIGTLRDLRRGHARDLPPPSMPSDPR